MLPLIPLFTLGALGAETLVKLITCRFFVTLIELPYAANLQQTG
jgi:hypothetical protein